MASLRTLAITIRWITGTGSIAATLRYPQRPAHRASGLQRQKGTP